MLNSIVTYIVGGMAITAVFALRATATAKRTRPVAVRESPPRARAKGMLGLAVGLALALNLSACGESANNDADAAAAEKEQTDVLMAEADANADEAKDESDESAPVQVTGKEHFQKVTAEGKVLVDFYADWCGPCKAMAPILKDLARSRSDSLTVAKVNVDKHRDLAMEHGVRGIPHLVLFKDGEAVDSSTGYRDKKALTNWLAEFDEG
ncbi:MAG: thioredoxin [Verrucomicrobiota bacterium]